MFIIDGLNLGNSEDVDARFLMNNGLRSRVVHNIEEMEIVYMNTVSLITHLTNSILLF
jgi:ribosomal protein L32E